ncbi:MULTISPECIES: SGNH/GDSL hydrolase family protein [unclassified Psychrobacter]|uniref:SGNH/GDSL hydrolase family protein n=1 Tax=unclassified Psychrobacter TaxID=196806 RepID=UPI00071E99F9|nr:MULTISPECIES: SGNH/GDSL hydrolase family protein [unclassified Psychrobacter]OLF35670.1 G-D-S-L lipolytic protein [Psychrobacter sp. Cmf 22.2]
MVAPLKISAIAKDVLLAPIYLYQGRKVKRDTVRLPEPEGERQGHIQLRDSAEMAATEITKTLSLMIVGDSAAAGVGSLTQQEALAGKLIPALQQKLVTHTQFDRLSWSLQATTGHTSFDILRRLYILPTPHQPVDIMVLSVGVNDATSNVSISKWQQQIEQIIAIAQRKFDVQTLIFSSLPPMAQMPALPSPLNNFIGAKATKLDQVLQSICAQHSGVHHMAADFELLAEKHTNEPINSIAMFASDGFHPSSLTYGYWAQQLAELIAQLLDSSFDKTVIKDKDDH